MPTGPLPATPFPAGRCQLQEVGLSFLAALDRTAVVVAKLVSTWRERITWRESERHKSTVEEERERRGEEGTIDSDPPSISDLFVENPRLNRFPMSNYSCTRAEPLNHTDTSGRKKYIFATELSLLLVSHTLSSSSTFSTPPTLFSHSSFSSLPSPSSSLSLSLSFFQLVDYKPFLHRPLPAGDHGVTMKSRPAGANCSAGGWPEGDNEGERELGEREREKGSFLKMFFLK